MTFTESINTCLFKKYGSIEGRASRSEYWWFALFNTLPFILLVIIGIITGSFDDDSEIGMGMGIVLILFSIFFLAIIIPAITVSVRRLHDLGQSGWWIMGFIVLSAIPIVGSLVTIAMYVYFAMPGKAEANRFGDAPSLN